MPDDASGAFRWRPVRIIAIVAGVALVEHWLISGYLHPPGEDEPFQFVPAVSTAIAAFAFGYEWGRRHAIGAMALGTIAVVGLLAANSVVRSEFLNINDPAGEDAGPLVLLVFLPAILLFIAMGSHVHGERDRDA